MRTAALAGRCLGATFSRRASVTAHSTKAQMSTTAAPTKHWLLTYTYVEGIVEKRGPYRAAHLAGAQEQADAGKLVMAGAVGEPPSGATFVWSPAASEEDIRRFVQSDVYVSAGLVTAWSIAPFAVVVKGA
ncbi:YCII-related protein [Haematococcus lacustris]